MRRTRHRVAFGPPSALPIELITDILEYLPADALWTTARVSRQFYAAARRAGLCIHRNISWSIERSLPPELAVLREIIEQAQQKDLLLSLCLSIYFYGQGQIAELCKAAEPAANQLLQVISLSLPFLNYLSIMAPDHLHSMIYHALRSPAPRLRTLELNTTDHAIPLPHGFLGGVSAQLHAIVLGTTALPQVPVPAFGTVSRAALTYSDTLPPVNIGRQFPSLINLRLIFPATVDDDKALTRAFDFSGLELHSLVIEQFNLDMIRVSLLGMAERFLDLSTITAIKIGNPPILWSNKTSAKDDVEVSVRIALRDEDELRVSIIPAHQLWRHAYGVTYWDTDLPLSFGELPSLSMKLVYLRIDAPLVRGFLALEVPFPMLRDLHVDIHEELDEQGSLAPPDYAALANSLSFDGAPNAPRIWAPCRALEEVTLFAVDMPIYDAESRPIAFLMHALGQLQRPTGERAELALVGFAFAEPIALALLKQTTSRVCSYGFAGRDSREDHDEGLWEYDLFHMG